MPNVDIGMIPIAIFHMHMDLCMGLLRSCIRDCMGDYGHRLFD